MLKCLHKFCWQLDRRHRFDPEFDPTSFLSKKINPKTFRKRAVFSKNPNIQASESGRGMFGRGMGKQKLFPFYSSYRLSGIIHREQGEHSAGRSPRRTVSNSGRAMFEFSPLQYPVRLATGFAARPGRRMTFLKRSTLFGRISPQDGGLRPITNTQNFSPASGSDEFYKAFAGGGQGGISLLVNTSCQIL